MLLGDHIGRQFGQSLWSIVTTIAERNWLSFAEIGKVFGDPALPRAFARKIHRSFHSLAGFNQAKIKQLQGDASIPLSLTETSTYQFGACNLDDDFRYCPRCVSEGVHSPIHQVPANRDCLWHGVELEKGCPTCGIRVSFTLDHDLARSPNRCVNGHKILNRKESFTLSEYDALIDRQPLKSYLAVVRKASAFADKDGDARVRPLLSDAPRHEQLPLFARRLGVNNEGSDVVKSVIDWRTGIQSTAYRFRLSNGKNSSWSDRKRLESLRNDPVNAVVRLFNEHWLESEFRESVDRVAEHLHKTVLAGHQSCWSLADNDGQASFDTGLSCIWVTAFKLWRIRHSECLYYKKRKVDKKHPYVLAWSDIADRYLANPVPGWKRCGDMSAYLFLATKYTEYSLRASFWSILRRVNVFVKYKKKFTFDELVQSAMEVQPNCVYICKRSPESGELVLWVDNEFGGRQNKSGFPQRRVDSCTDVPGDLWRWAIADSYRI